MQPERELDDDAEVPPAPAQRPEELGVFVLAGGDDAAVGGDDFRGQQVVERQTVRRAQMADAAAERQAGDARVAESPSGRREPVPLTGRIEILPERAAAAGCRARPGIDDDVAHETQVDGEAPVTDAMSRDAVAAAAYRNREALVAGERHRCDHVV